MKYLAVVLTILLFCTILRANEDRIRIGLIDSGLDTEQIGTAILCDGGHKDFTNTNLEDNLGHGTLMAKAIMRFVSVKTHCIVNIKWIDAEEQNLDSAVEYASVLDLGYINISAGGSFTGYREYTAIQVALTRGIKVSVAAGNERHNLDVICYYYPACYMYPSPNFYVVGALDKDGNKEYYSNYGKVVNAWALGSYLGMEGTSVSAAMHTGRLALRDYIASL